MTATSSFEKTLLNKPILPLISAWLFTFVGGFASAYAYISLGGVFANMQTGNIIKSVIFAVEGKDFSSLLLSIAFYVIGVIAAVLLGKVRFGNIISVIIEMSAISLCLIFAKNGEENMLTLNLAVSFSCALQFEFFHAVGSSGFTSVMCTNNLRAGIENLLLGAVEKNGKKAVEGVYFLLFDVIFAGGVALGAVAALKFGYYSIGFVLIPLAIILCLQIAVDCGKGKDEK